VTLFGLMMTPVFFVVIGSAVEWLTQRRTPEPAPLTRVAAEEH
jgi:hypothetical protein